MSLEALVAERKSRYSCREPWFERAAKAGHKPAMAEYANILTSEHGDVGSAIKLYQLSGTERSDADNYYYSLLMTISATDLDAVTSGIALMQDAIEKLKKSDYEYLRIAASFGHVLDLESHMKKTLDQNLNYSQRNFVLALLALGELENSLPEVIRAVEIGLDTREYLPIVRSSTIRRTASVIAEAIRNNKSYTEVLRANLSSKATSFGLAETNRTNKTQTTKTAVAVPANNTTPVPTDSERQAKTGYLAGATNAATGGLSTFTVDNSTGERDAVVRLYLGGRKPAARSVYVKLGEKFTAKSLMPGTYVMRYRFIGNVDTFEAEAPFVLNETMTEKGRRFSAVTVTLFKVLDGNMKSKIVSSDEF
ncbi:MAG: hypothetical protein LH479_02600 [Polaromonas sp.]|nr:hypothetical protein [Polaromonas sp.]